MFSESVDGIIRGSSDVAYFTVNISAVTGIEGFPKFSAVPDRELDLLFLLNKQVT
jgi:hypothetical protein